MFASGQETSLETQGGTEECCVGRQLVHLDLKSPNVLLQDKNWLVAKIADLGVSKYLVEGSLLDFTMRGVQARPSGAHSADSFQTFSSKYLDKDSLRNSTMRGAPSNPALYSW